MTATVTTEFRSEYEQELTDWLRRRFTWYCVVLIGLSVIGLMLLGVFMLMLLIFIDPETIQVPNVTNPTQLIPGVRIGEGDQVGQPNPISGPEFYRMSVSNQIAALLSTGIGMWLYIRTLLVVRRDAHTRDETIGLLGKLIITVGLINIAISVINVELYRVIAPAAYDAGSLLGVQGVLSIFLTHMFASLFLPWTPRESIKPMIPLVLANIAVSAFYYYDRTGVFIGMSVASVAAGVPGLLVCWIRRLRFRRKFHFKMLKGRYGELKREMLDARRLHESLFPDQLLSGSVTVRYSYEPMREIGGDFLFAKQSGEIAHVVLIDVTGHGVGAALTVNRLHGELERQFGMQSDPSPEAILSGLNEYLHFALASHSIYATALCIRVDAAEGTIEHASAGHPPAFLRTADGRMDRLESTTIVLGVVHPDHFEAAPERNDFMRGDALIAYTDGATEAVTSTGKMIRVDGLERIAMKTAPRSTASGIASRKGRAPDEIWCNALLTEVERLRQGPTLDDTLIVEVRRPV